MNYSLLTGRLAAFLGFLAVALGAFGAHSLQPRLLELGTVAIWEKAGLYHLVHAVVLLVLSFRSPLPKIPCLCFLIGIVVFSGSLYLYAATKLVGFAMVTPIGGLALLAGWAALYVSAEGDRPV